MELRQLRYFVAVAQQLNFSRAARSVHVTQSTVSHQIKLLEDELGYKLFERSLHHVNLTKQGEVFLSRVVQILKDLKEAAELGRTANSLRQESLRLLIGVHTIGMWMLPGALQRFQLQCPHVSIEVEDVLSNQVIENLESGDYDLAVGDEETLASYAFEPLCREELVLVVGGNHPMAGRKRIRMNELHDQPLLLVNESFSYRRRLDHCFESAGAEPRIIAEFNLPTTLLNAVSERGFGGIITHNFPNWFNHLGLIRIQLDNPTPFRTIVLYWKKKSLSDSARILANILRDQIHQTTRSRKDLGLHL